MYAFCMYGINFFAFFEFLQTSVFSEFSCNESKPGKVCKIFSKVNYRKPLYHFLLCWPWMSNQVRLLSVSTPKLFSPFLRPYWAVILVLSFYELLKVLLDLKTYDKCLSKKITSGLFWSFRNWKGVAKCWISEKSLWRSRPELKFSIVADPWWYACSCRFWTCWLFSYRIVRQSIFTRNARKPVKLSSILFLTLTIESTSKLLSGSLYLVYRSLHQGKDWNCR